MCFRANVVAAQRLAFVLLFANTRPKVLQQEKSLGYGMGKLKNTNIIYVSCNYNATPIIGFFQRTRINSSLFLWVSQ